MALVIDTAAEDSLYRTTDIPDYDAEYTCSFWLRRIGGTFGWVCCFLIAYDSNNYDWYGTDGAGIPKWHVGVFPGGETSSTEGPSINAWYFLVCQRSGGAARLFVDGIQKTSYGSTPSRSSPGEMELGNDLFGLGWGYGGSRSIANVKLWTAAVPITEVMAEMYVPYAIRRADLYADWRTPLGASQYKDFSGHGHDWTVMGTPTEGPQPPKVQQDHQLYRLSLAQIPLHVRRMP